MLFFLACSVEYRVGLREGFAFNSYAFLASLNLGHFRHFSFVVLASLKTTVPPRLPPHIIERFSFPVFLMAPHRWL